MRPVVEDAVKQVVAEVGRLDTSVQGVEADPGLFQVLVDQPLAVVEGETDGISLGVPDEEVEEPVPGVLLLVLQE